MRKKVIIESLDVLKARQQLEESTYVCYDNNCVEKTINDIKREGEESEQA